MLLKLLLDASRAVPGSGFARLLRRIDRALQASVEADSRTAPVVTSSAGTTAPASPQASRRQ
jgi:hypothetical protein